MLYYDAYNFRLHKIILIAIFIKLIHYLIIYLSANLLIFNVQGYLNNFHFDNENITIWNAFKTWDGQIYLYIAKHGYEKFSIVNAHYPLYPLLIRLFTKITGIDYFFIGLTLSSLFSILSSLLLFLYTRNITDEKIAFLTTLFYLVFPSSFHTSLIYSESTFVLLLLSFFYFKQTQKNILVNLSSFLLPLSRPQGVFILLPIIIEIILNIKNKEKYKNFQFFLSCILGLFCYFSIMYYYTGDFFSGFKAQQLYISKHSLYYFIHPVEWFYNNFIAKDFYIHGFNNSIIDRVFFVFAIFSLYYIYINFNFSIFLFSVIMIMVPALSDSFTSFSRYILPVFPIYISIAKNFKTGYLFIILLSFAIQTFFLIAHSLNCWIS